ncbi:N-acetyllactosaminide beta-1,3-N-acetylglucosaminyltransferase 3-like [Protopterus annectens]|uniref:N-acetyllactosaminide beta-1,3-N-acetylglucosaminyltransferase 3-like n=1 Tax=Protopterus annectens TaxID=7888 RepID=UPI001CFA5FBC|nr:N-acetyllactosaminide beta-1,3-N-acetylglucosaminyltransferase 3-like [Protopterus annectens]XP_043946566.1 N-acetyllactosaminide beta-1,3-N-acetylglucosaminyltransferase 3-like [Protopterus annectens]
MYRWNYSVGYLVLFGLGTYLLFLLFLGQPQNNFQKVNEKMTSVPARTTENLSNATQPNVVLDCIENASFAKNENVLILPDHIKDFLKYRHCKSFPLLRETPKKCGGPEQSDKVFLLLAIKSSPKNYARREAIRKTWGGERIYEGVQIQRLFILGVTSDQKQKKKLQHLLSIESEENGDILQWDFYDTFFNLTLKQVLFHEWLEQNCPHVKFLLNGDDDVFVNSDAVVQYLLGLNGNNGDKHLFVGQLVKTVYLERDKSSKYYVPEIVASQQSYPPYCAGGGFLLSGFTARQIYKASLNITLLPIDDIYIGMCLERAGLSPESHISIKTGGLSVPSDSMDSFDPCFYKDMLLVHRFLSYEMIVMWKAIHDPTLECGISVI